MTSKTDDGDDDLVDREVEAASDPVEPEGRPGRRTLRHLSIAAAGATLVAALTCSGLLGWRLWQQRQVDEAGRQAVEEAVAYAQTLTSIDSNHVDENFTRVLDGATGEFKDMYTQSSVQLRQLLVDNKATAHGTVVDSAIQSRSEDRVVILLMVDQTVANTARPDPRVDRSRMKITMQRVDDRWLAGKVELP
ncbi:Mce protein [Mycobacterium sp. NPDC003449]